MSEISFTTHIYLADDDKDDRFLFQYALKELGANAKLTTAKDGVELMEMLNIPPQPLPDLILLDLNMPRKNGFQCLEEIKQHELLSKLPVVIFSTTAQEEAVHRTYRDGASMYICKPGDFEDLKQIIQKVLSINWRQHCKQASLELFVLKIS